METWRAGREPSVLPLETMPVSEYLQVCLSGQSPLEIGCYMGIQRIFGAVIGSVHSFLAAPTWERVDVIDWTSSRALASE
jgi:hypothetical protein